MDDMKPKAVALVSNAFKRSEAMTEVETRWK